MQRHPVLVFIVVSHLAVPGLSSIVQASTNNLRKQKALALSQTHDTVVHKFAIHERAAYLPFAESSLERRKRRMVNYRPRHSKHHKYWKHQHSYPVRFHAENSDVEGMEDPLDSETDDMEAHSARKSKGPSDNDISMRPAAGGDPDIVRFGMYTKHFYGAYMKTNTFHIDLILSLKWKDSRVTDMVPDGLERIVVSPKEAQKKIWVPDIVVTNHDLGGIQIISSSVEIFASGEVEKVERSQVRISDSFQLSQYPFDSQDFSIKIASAKYMSEDLILEPMKRGTSSGIPSSVFEGSTWHLEGWDAFSVEEADGNLVKSRGTTVIHVRRSLEKYGQDHLVPSFIVLAISWAVFYFPFASAFITPRLVLSIVALLTFTNLMVKSTKLLPGAAPFNWNDLLNQLIQSLQFVTIVINIFSEVFYHQFNVENLARAVNHEAKIVLPTLSSTCIVFILGSGKFGLVTLEHATLIVQTVVIVTVGAYFYWCFHRFNASGHKDREEDATSSTEYTTTQGRKGGKGGLSAVTAGGGSGGGHC